MRLDKYIASVTDYSRSQVKRLIKAREVCVDEQLATDPGQQVTPESEVSLADTMLRAARPRYFMLNKPQGYVCASKDREHLTVFDLLDEDNLDKLHVAGRLDIDTTGLVLISDDGQWTHRITSPRHGCEKTYRLETADPITPDAVKAIKKGLFLKDSNTRTRPGELVLIDEQTGRLTISEGRYHQVKRMFAALGNRVLALHRERIGAVVLDETLEPGAYRSLSADEVAAL